MRIRQPFGLLLLSAIVAASASGCAWSLGGSRTLQVSYSRNTSIGRELLDLQEAKDKGALTPEEFQRARKAILDNETPAEVKNLTTQAIKAN